MADIDRVYYRLIFPENLEHKAVEAFVANVGALPTSLRFDIPGNRTAVIFEVWGDRSGIHHRINVPANHKHLVDQLRTAISGLHVEEDQGLPLADFTLAQEYGITPDIAPLQIYDPEQAAASILTSLQPLGSGEVVVIQWVVAPTNKQPPKPKTVVRPGLGRAPMKSKDPMRFMAGAIWNIGSAINDKIVDGIANAQEAREREKQEMVREKWQGHMFTATCRVAVCTPNGNAEELHDRIFNALQATSATTNFNTKSFVTHERLLDGVQRGSIPTFNWPCLLNKSELSVLLAFPIGSPGIPGLSLGGSYQAPPSSNIPMDGRTIAYSLYSGEERPLAIPWNQTQRHFYTVGRSGSGKTFLLENCAVQDMETGNGMVYIDPKGDSALKLIDCIPADRVKDTIYFDPANKREVLGFNLFSGSTENPGLTATNVVGLFKKLYKSNWGAKLENTLFHAVRTVAEIPYLTLLEVSELLTNDVFRSQILQQAKLSTPVRDFWAYFDDKISKSEREQMLAPLLNKLQPFGSRDEIRHVIGQSIGLNMQEIISGRKILIMNLQKGKLGEENTQLLGSIIMMMLWQAIQRRPLHEGKIPFYCTVDECQDFLNLATPLSDILAQARGYGFGLTLANQFLHQLGDLQHDVLSNVSSFAYFKLPADDAEVAAKQYPSLTANDFLNIGAYQVITSISTQHAITPKPTAGHTYAEVDKTGSAAAVLENTKRYTYPCLQTDEDLIRRREAYTKRPTQGYRKV